MNTFDIAIKAETSGLNKEQTVGTYALSNGKELKFIKGYSPVFDLDNICEVLGIELFPGVGKTGWEDFFGSALGPSATMEIREQLAKQGCDMELLYEVRDYIHSQPVHQYARRGWTKHVSVNTFGA